jgi:hypothetical protein
LSCAVRFDGATTRSTSARPPRNGAGLPNGVLSGENEKLPFVVATRISAVARASIVTNTPFGIIGPGGGPALGSDGGTCFAPIHQNFGSSIARRRVAHFHDLPSGWIWSSL